MTWEWIGGRLCRGNVSLSVTEAYEAQPGNPEIARACKDVLMPYDCLTVKRDNKKPPPM